MEVTDLVGPSGRDKGQSVLDLLIPVLAFLDLFWDTSRSAHYSGLGSIGVVLRILTATPAPRKTPMIKERVYSKLRAYTSLGPVQGHSELTSYGARAP